jgi:hypothetical protein
MLIIILIFDSFGFFFLSKIVILDFYHTGNFVRRNVFRMMIYSIEDFSLHDRLLAFFPTIDLSIDIFINDREEQLHVVNIFLEMVQYRVR